jgi:hemolysin activation/secretion protein
VKKVSHSALIGASFILGLMAPQIVMGQNIPSSAAPERIEERFRKPVRPKSTSKPRKHKLSDVQAPKDLEKIKFVLKKLVVEGSTIYSNKSFSRLDRKYRGRKISLRKVYAWANRITAIYRNNVSRAE